jgi:hypothetical protein
MLIWCDTVYAVTSNAADDDDDDDDYSAWAVIFVPMHTNRRMSKSSRRSSALPGGMRALAGGQQPARTQSMPLSAARHSMPLSLSSSYSSSDAAKLSTSDVDLKRALSLPPPSSTAEAADAAGEAGRDGPGSSLLRETLGTCAAPRPKRVHSAASFSTASVFVAACHVCYRCQQAHWCCSPSWLPRPWCRCQRCHTVPHHPLEPSHQPSERSCCPLGGRCWLHHTVHIVDGVHLLLQTGT